MRAWLLAVPLALLQASPSKPPKPAAAEVFSVIGDDESEGPSHTLALGRFRKQDLAFVADEDGGALLAFSTSDMRFVSRTRLEGKPSSVRVLPNGELAVTLRDRARVAFVEAARDGLRVRATVDTCVEPVSTNADAEALLVVCAWGHALDVLSLQAGHVGARLARFDLPREPRAAVVAKDGTVFVSHAVGSRLSVVDRARGSVTDRPMGVAGVSPSRPEVGFGIFGGFSDEAAQSPEEARRPRFALQGFSLAYFATEASERLFVPEVLVAPVDAPTRRGGKVEPPPMRSLGYGGSFVAGVAQAPRAAEVPFLATIRPSDPRLPTAPAAPGTSRCLLPRAAKTTAAGRVLVACLGSDEVLEYDGLAPDPDAALLLRAHVAHGPTGVAFKDMRIFVWSTFDRVLTRLDDNAFDVAAFETVSDTAEREPTPFEVGRRLFHRTDSSRISGDGRACASCHPDGRDDGLVWSSPDGPRQTPMLAGRLADTPPFGWTGNADTVREHLKQTFARLGGAGLDDKSLYALLTYLAKMAPPPAGPSQERVANGKRIFESYDAGCHDCHDPSRGLTDGERHDVGSKTKADVRAAFETPSLRHVGGTAPYFHDGRFATLEDLLRGSPRMADTSHLSDAEIGDLAAYLRTL